MTDDRKIWEPGERLSVQQGAKSYTGFARRRRKYTICFKIGDDGRPVHCAGVKPTQETIDRVTRYVLSGSTDPCNVYRTLWLTDLGYVVYRYCFDEEKCTLEEGARAHKQAVFVDEVAAKDYCRYRNDLIDKRGTDAL